MSIPLLSGFEALPLGEEVLDDEPLDRRRRQLGGNGGIKICFARKFSEFTRVDNEMMKFPIANRPKFSCRSLASS